MKSFSHIVMAIVLLCLSIHAQAAFPVAQLQAHAEKISVTKHVIQKNEKGIFNRLIHIEKQRIAALSARMLHLEPMAERGKASRLCFLLGWAGAHRFYLGYTWQGIVQAFDAVAIILLITSALNDNVDLFGFALAVMFVLGIWILVDFIRILAGTLEPKDSKYL